MAHGVTTEWFDQQVKYGNYLPNEKQVTNDEIENIIRNEIEKYDPLENKKIEELDELEDLEDERIIQKYKEKRIHELQEYARGAKFGQLREIRKDDYIKEVNEASKESFVVLLLHQDYIEQSRILNEILIRLAKKFPCVKFLRIEATNCIKDFEDKSVPAIFIYKDEKVFKQFVPAPYYLGGARMTANKVEWVLSSLKVLDTDLEADPFDESSFKIKKQKIKRDDESDSEEENKPNRWNI